MPLDLVLWYFETWLTVLFFIGIAGIIQDKHNERKGKK